MISIITRYEDGDWTRAIRFAEPWILSIRCWSNLTHYDIRSVEVCRVSGYGSGYRNVETDYNSPELFALACDCDLPEPVLDWLIENALTPEQLEIAKVIQQSLAGELS